MDVLFIVYITVATVTIAMNSGIAIADFAGAQFVTANSAELGVPASWQPALGALKVAGVVGLIVGLLWLPALAIAAATGLVLFYGGAILTHIRAGVFYNLAFPGTFLAFAVATLALAIANLN
jgi:DoxX-like family